MILGKLHGITHGFVLGQGGSWIQTELQDSQLIEQFEKWHQIQLPFQDLETEKQLFLACLVNVQDVLGQVPKGPSRLWPMLDLFKIQSVKTFFELLTIRSRYLASFGHSWVPFLHETLPQLPQKTISDLLKHFKDDSMNYLLTCVRVEQAGKSAPSDHDLQKLSFLELCFVLLSMICSKYVPEFELEVFSTNLKVLDSKNKLVELIIAQLKSKIENITIDAWMNLTELSTENFQASSSLKWWPQKGQNWPSNQQMLVSHYCYEISQVLPELQPVLANFAREYKREYELGIEDMDLEQVLAKLEQHDSNDWQVEFFLNDLMTNRLAKALDSDKAVQVLEKFAVNLVPFIDSIKNCRHARLVLSIMKECQLEQVQNLLVEKLTSGQVYKHNIEDEARIFLNKTVTQSDNFEKDWLVLVYQNPRLALDIIVLEACDNPGKIDLAKDLILKLPFLPWFHVSELLIQHLLDGPQNGDNLKNLVVKLCSNNSEIAAEISRTLLDRIISDKETMLVTALNILVQVKDCFELREQDKLLLLDIQQGLLNKKCKSIQDGNVLQLLNCLCINDDSLSDNEWLGFHLTQIKPHLWQKFPMIELLQVASLITKVSDTEESKAYILNQVSKTMALTDHEDVVVDYLDLHDKLIMLLIDNSEHESLQNLYLKVLNKVLQESQDSTLKHVLASIACLPKHCSTRHLSLTKISMHLKE